MKKEQIDGLDFGKWPLPTEYLQEIGRVTVLWSSLEVKCTLIYPWTDRLE